jgi:hypothetical protein
MRTRLLLTSLAVALAFALGYGTSSLSRPARLAAQRPAKPFLDEMQEINVDYCARLEEAARRRPDDEVLAEIFRAWRVRYHAAVRECYERHGKELPPNLK